MAPWAKQHRLYLTTTQPSPPDLLRATAHGKSSARCTLESSRPNLALLLRRCAGGGVTSLLRSSQANTGMRAVASSPTTTERPCASLPPVAALKHGCANRDLAASDMAAATTSSTAWNCDPSPVFLARRGIVEHDPSPCMVLSSHSLCLRSSGNQRSVALRVVRLVSATHVRRLPFQQCAVVGNVTELKVLNRLAESLFALVLQ
ncbi:hypothetical protein SVAN01_02166 [Stagonosporopsis vannaccii]|nr:hypothetical protein SVAN01_02166 [Stagonosporopsis vannaccii]